jgi:cell division topological specificity factor
VGVEGFIMSGFLDRMFGRSKESSAVTAKERLQFVLVHDRINISPEKLKAMKEEILAVISKYVAVSSEEVDIALEQRDRNQNKLIAEIPFSKSLEEAPQPIDDDEASRPPTKPSAKRAKAADSDNPGAEDSETTDDQDETQGQDSDRS